MEFPTQKPRSVCGHCDKDLSKTQYYMHKRLYFANGDWVRESKRDQTDAVQDSVASSQDHGQDHTGESNEPWKLEDQEETWEGKIEEEEMHLLLDDPEKESIPKIPDMNPPSDAKDKAHSEIRISNVVSTMNGGPLNVTSPSTPLSNGDGLAPRDRILMAAINGVSRQITALQREMNQNLDELNQAAASGQALLVSMDERLTALGRNRSSGPEGKRKRRAQCPKLAESVRRLHNSKTNDRRYDPEETISSRHNEAVTTHLVDTLAGNPDWRTLRTDLIVSACKTYYATVRRNFCYGQPEFEHLGTARKSSARSRQRRQRLLATRQSVLVPDEVEFWSGTTIDMMSDEEDGTSEGLFGWIVRPPSFRSQELSDLCAKLQTRLEADKKHARGHRRLYTGADSDRLPPRSYNPENAKKHFKPEISP
ncbi:uncharacterized protein C14orf93-like [Limanda limanda]|uniref:uncharacterized protein C14orf93-like n=1 Tax=Limanda limanda TaxID=27771 RepID=UPI0029C69AC0|nr:uncharacterized protein C14orf93-like [Limanda limanda]